MASFLASLGVTNTTAKPDPSAYADQQQESANLADARSSLSTTTSSIQLALSAAEAVGISSQSLTDLNAQASTLASSSTLSSAQLAAQVNSINNKLAITQVQQAAAIKAQAIADMTAAIATIQTRVSTVQADKTTSAGLLVKYNTLLQLAKGALNALQHPPVDISGAIPPTYPTPDVLLSNLDDLDTLKDTEENAAFNWTRFFKRILVSVIYYSAIVSIALGALLGGIIMSNAYASDYFWGIKLYYFIYGAVFFPLSLLYGAIQYPYWISGLIPLYSLIPVVLPVAPSAPVVAPTGAAPKATVLGKAAAAAKSAAAALASKLPALGSKLPTSLTSKLPTSLTSLFGGGVDLSGVSAPSLPALSLMDSLFGYTLVTSDPTLASGSQAGLIAAQQLSSRSSLWRLSLIEIGLLSTFTVYYGVDKLLMKNKV